jgi:ferredoxin
MKLLYFTSTGNSLYVAKRIADGYQIADHTPVDILSIPQVLNTDVTSFKDEAIGLIFPAYAFIPPKIVLEFMEKVTLNSPYIFIIMTFGNEIADGPQWTVEYAKKLGIDIQYASSLLMIDNYLPGYDITKQKQMDKKIEENLTRIINELKARKQLIQEASSEQIKTHAKVRKLMKVLGHISSPKMFKVNNDCIYCKTCQKVCPRNNINVTDSKVIFGKNCEFCLGCVNNCPKKAIKIRFMDKNPNERFRNENISLAEIIKSNNVQ